MSEQLNTAEMPTMDLREAYMPEAEGHEGSSLIGRVAERMLHNKALRTGVAALAIAAGGEAIASSVTVEDALASSTPAVTTPEQLPSSVTATFKTETSSATSSVSDIAKGKQVILVNNKAKGMSRKKVHALEKDGQCEVLDGTKVRMYSRGYHTGSKQYGRDYRTSEICRVNGKLIRVKCGNEEIVKRKPKHAFENVKFVKSLKGRVRLHTEADARAICATSHTSASASAHAEADTYGSLKAFVKSRGHNVGSGKEVVRLYGAIKGQAVSKAAASANCAETSATIVIVNGETVVVPPKDSTQGAGAGTPGTTSTGSTVGGPGAGGSPESPTNTTGQQCIDTQGNIVNGPADQFGNC